MNPPEDATAGLHRFTEEVGFKAQRSCWLLKYRRLGKETAALYLLG